MYFLKHVKKTQEQDVGKIVENEVVILEAYEALNGFSMDEVDLRRR